MPLPQSQPLLRPAMAITRRIRTRPPVVPVQGTLALQWQLPGELDAVPSPDRSLRLLTREPALDRDTDPAVAVVATPRSALPDPGPWTGQLVQAVLEVRSNVHDSNSCGGSQRRSTPT